MLERRDFLKGLGALGVTLGFGSKVVSREADRSILEDSPDVSNLSIEVQPTEPILDANTLERVQEVLLGDTGKPKYAVAEPCSPDTYVTHDWSKELGDLLEKDFEVVQIPTGATHFNVPEPIRAEIKRKEMSDRFGDPSVTVKQHELDHMYCSFVIRDGFEQDMGFSMLRDCFFIPSLYQFKTFIEEECEGKRLAVQRLALPTYPGIRGAISDGGPIPIRTTAMYEITYSGIRVTLEFMAKVF